MRKQNGITLIALIITIIIMLILVGVSVNVVINSDIIRTADKAVKAWNEETQKENETINELDKLIDDLVNNRMDVTKPGLNGIFATSGYNVGMGDLLIKILSE